MRVINPLQPYTMSFRLIISIERALLRASSSAQNTSRAVLMPTHCFSTILILKLFHCHSLSTQVFITTTEKRRRPLSDFSRGCRNCLRGNTKRGTRMIALTSATVSPSETSYISRDDCFAAFCLVNRDWLSHRCSHCLAAARYRSADTPRKNEGIIAQNRRD